MTGASIACVSEAHFKAANIAVGAHKAFDDSARQVGSTLKDGSACIACKRGCNHCCSLQVTATTAELLLIAGYVRSMDALSQSIIDNNVKSAYPRVKGLGLGARHLSRTFCPLLNGAGECSIYPVRPLNCRSFVSFDALACRRDAKNPALNELVPQSNSLRDIRDHLMPQVLAHERSIGIPPRSFELIQGLKPLLESAETTKRVAAGEDILRDAVARG